VQFCNLSHVVTPAKT